ncbi:MAPEG family protein [Hyphomicrobium sp.]|uniref:MAPEG family protein n=1 Tax=Hyphomicrobium sp. TaxID=82 RepID=UPI0025BC77D2|nr:MAPEG family protein [Hyphomicrobium sp.]
MALATSLYAALLAALYMFLTINVIRGRRTHSVALGDGDVADMKARIRAHANFAEYAPFFLLLLLMAELQGLAVWAVHGLGVAFVVGRLSHAYGLLVAETRNRWMTPRVIGLGVTLSCLGMLVLILLAIRFV